MKKSKILLLGLIAGISFIGFSNADSFTLSSKSYLDYQNFCSGDPVITANGGQKICRANSCTYDSVKCESFQFRFGGLAVTSNVSLQAGEYTVSCSSYPCIVRFLGGISFEFQAPPPPILDGGNSNFVSILTSISSSISEFIPYLVYIGIGILGALIGFYSIRWFINWLRKKIFSSFK